jgi:hypothetical protein
MLPVTMKSEEYTGYTGEVNAPTCMGVPKPHTRGGVCWEGSDPDSSRHRDLTPRNPQPNEGIRRRQLERGVRLLYYSSPGSDPNALQGTLE